MSVVALEDVVVEDVEDQIIRHQVLNMPLLKKPDLDCGVLANLRPPDRQATFIYEIF